MATPAVAPSTTGAGTSLRQIIQAFAHETSTTPDWFAHEKHIFVFTWTGKPLFVRYGNDNKLVETIGTMLAFISNFQGMNNPLLSFQAGPYQFVILNKEPFYIFTIHRTKETVHQIKLAMNLLYAQLLSVLTHGTVEELEYNASYDPRDMLTGMDLLTHGFINQYDNNLSLMTQTLETIKMHRNTRAKIANVLKKYKHSSDSALFTMLSVDNKVVSVLQQRGFNCHVYDMQLILNMLANQPSLQRNESLTPMCLPFYNRNDLLWVYSYFLPINLVDKLAEQVVVGYDYLQGVYPPFQRELQGVGIKENYSQNNHNNNNNQYNNLSTSGLNTSSTSVNSTTNIKPQFQQYTNIALVMVCKDPSLFPKCQQLSGQIIAYLTDHTGELKQHDYVAALLTDNLIPDNLYTNSTNEHTNNTTNNNNNNKNNNNTSNNNSNNNTTTEIPLLEPSISFTQTRLQTQTVQTNPYLLDSIKQKYRDDLCQHFSTPQHLSTFKNTPVSLLHELHYATLSTSNAQLSPFDIFYEHNAATSTVFIKDVPLPQNSTAQSQNLPITVNGTTMSVYDYDPKTHYSFQSTIQTHRMVHNNIDNVEGGMATSRTSFRNNNNNANNNNFKKPTTPSGPNSTTNLTTGYSTPSLQTAQSANWSAMAQATPGGSEKERAHMASLQPCDLAHFVYLDLPSSSMIDSKALAPFKNITNGVSIQTYNTINLAPPEAATTTPTSPSSRTKQQNTPSCEHIFVAPQSKAVDNNGKPFHLGAFGAMCVTTTDTQGLVPNNGLTQFITQDEQAAQHRDDLTKVVVHPAVVHINTNAAQCPLALRYKHLYRITHRCISDKIDLEAINASIATSTTTNNTNAALPPTATRADGHGFRYTPQYVQKVLNPNFQGAQQQNNNNNNNKLNITHNPLDNIVLAYIEYHDAVVAYQSKPDCYELYCTFLPYTPKELIHSYMYKVTQTIQRDQDSYFQRVQQL